MARQPQNREKVSMASSNSMGFSVSGAIGGMSMTQNHMDKTLGWGSRASVGMKGKGRTSTIMAMAGGDGSNTYKVTLIMENDEKKTIDVKDD